MRAARRLGPALAVVLGAFAQAQTPFFTAGAEVTLSVGVGAQRDTPHVAFGGNEYLVVWREGAVIEGGRARILALRVSPNGSVLDGAPVEIAPSSSADHLQLYPRVAYGQNVFLVVWQDFRNGTDSNILAARVALDGTVLDAQPIAVAGGGGTEAMPDVASDGRNFVVVFQAHPDSPQRLTYKTLAVSVGADGTTGTATEVMSQPHPVIGWNGASYLVAAGGAEVVFRGALYTRLLGPPDAGVVNMQKFLPGDPPMLSIAPEPGKGWLLVTQRVRPDFWGWSGPAAMRAYLILDNGLITPELPAPEQKIVPPSTLLPGWLDVQKAQRPTPVGTGIPVGPNASAWDGQRVVVVWQRFHQAKPIGYSMPLENCDLIIGRVDGWKALDPYGMPVVDSPDDELLPAMASDGAGHLLLVYVKRAPGEASIAARPLTTF